MFNPLRQFVSFDWLLALSVFVLGVLGVSSLYSIGLANTPPDFSNVTKQLALFVVGIFLVVFLAASSYRLLQSYAGPLYIAGAGLLTAVLIFGVERRGTVGWFDLGIVDMQPVEFVKIILVVTIAAVLARRKTRRMGWRELLPTIPPVLIYVLLVLMQPDFGSGALLLGTWGIMLLFAGLEKKLIAAIAGAGVLGGAMGWFVLFQDFQRQRILTFLQPGRDPLGDGYNVLQAKIAIGAGRVMGRGLGFGSQSQLRFLPEVQTDFIFAAIAEELGFFGVCLVVGAFALFFWRVWTLVKWARDDFTAYLVVGLGALLFLQASVNIAMNLGMSPVTGLTLPFVSYGGSSLLSSLIIFGILQSVALRRHGTL